jgi:DNA-binding CsgD family transcriptional regulator
MLALVGEAIRAIGTSQFGAAFHDAVGSVAPATHLTIIRYPDCGSPQALLVSSVRAKALIDSLTADYVRRYYRMDPQLAAIARLEDSTTTARVLRRRSSDFGASYRRHFFASSSVADKISIVWRAGAGWQSINLYATCDHGCYSASELRHVAAMAPVLASAAGRHAELVRGGVPQVAVLVPAIAAMRGAQLTAREREVAAGILQGRTTGQIGEMLGIAPSSVHTFRKILYRKLRIASQAQLFSLALMSGGAGIRDRSLP